jgi:hypothetical protein
MALLFSNCILTSSNCTSSLTVSDECVRTAEKSASDISIFPLLSLSGKLPFPPEAVHYQFY